MNSENSYSIGLDLGGTSIKYGISSSEGIIFKEFTRPTQADQPIDIILNDLANAAQEALQYSKENNIHPMAVGIGTPGSVDVNKGFLMGSTPNLKYWKNVPIKEYLEKQLNIPVYADNDGNLMAFGEAKFGAGKGYSDVVCITLGTGIGGGIIINGQIFRGSFFAGTEVGHMSINHKGIKCRCGGVGCWEKYASATAMIDNYNKLKPNSNTTSTIQIFENYQNKDSVAIEVIEEEIKMAAAGLVNIVNIFNPEIIIIGGGVSEAGEWFINRIAKATEAFAMKPAMKNVKIVKAELGNKAGWLGAAAFALTQLD